ncbi:hypothetical protein I7I51_02310 [Histoplasma capsulatum]|uniref:Uncharacterized protein n=1 Tax=Ajellomyces capsulatus TaxID=5037 RepID=A0A8A1MDI8_AJECA|nr:hypothetical protein I7I51_02310 [Histoplasma capsulatum]
MIAPYTSPSVQLEWQLTETVTECKTVIHRYKRAARAIVNLLLTASCLAHGLLVSRDQVQGFCQYPTQVSIQVTVKLGLKQSIVVFVSEPLVDSETMIVAPTGISGVEITRKEDCNDRTKILCCF